MPKNSKHVINKNEKLWSRVAYQEFKTCSTDRFTFSNVSEGILEITKVQRPLKVSIFQEDQLEAFKKPDSITIKFGWYHWKATEVIGWRFFSRKRTFIEATMRNFRRDSLFFVDWSPHVEIIIKELWCHCPLNYWRKGRSVWWELFV